MALTAVDLGHMMRRVTNVVQVLLGRFLLVDRRIPNAACLTHMIRELNSAVLSM